VSEEDIRKALLLARNLRFQAIIQNINPIATRIAIKYLLAVDTLFAKDKISQEQDKAMDTYVKHLVKITSKG